MTIEILMPSFSPDMEDGQLVKWLVQPGDVVEQGDVIAEVETDKATMECEADHGGVIDSLLVAAGSPAVKVGAPIATLRDATGAPAPTLAQPVANAKPAPIQPEWPEDTPLRDRTVRDALRDALVEEMRADADVFLIGEEVAQNQGAFKVTQGLLDEFGSRRVVDAPITETGFAGLGVGAAFAGLRPVVEFMSFNFALQALDQIINTAAKTHYMSGGTLNCPIVFRGPHGTASRVGAQHAQDFAALFAHIPGLKVVAPYAASDAKGLLKSAIRDNAPVIFLENEELYSARGQVPVLDDFTLPLGKARIWREGSDVTLVGFGHAMRATLAAADQLADQGITAEVIDLRCLRPLDHATVLASVRKTHRCVTVEDGLPMGSIGQQIATVVMQQGFDDLDAPVATVTGADLPMPYAENLEALACVNANQIVQAALQVCYRTPA